MLDLEDIKREIEALSPKERFQIIEWALESFGSDGTPIAQAEIDKAWEATVLRRSEEISSGKVTPVSEEQVKEVFLKKYGYTY